MNNRPQPVPNENGFPRSVTMRFGCDQPKADHSFVVHRRIMAGANIFMLLIIAILSWFTVEVDIAKTGLIPILTLNLFVIILSIYSFHTTLLAIYVIGGSVYTIFLIVYIIFYNLVYAASFPKTFYLIIVGINTGLTACLNAISIGLAIGMLRRCGWKLTRWREGRRVATTIDSNIDKFVEHSKKIKLTTSTHFKKKKEYV